PLRARRRPWPPLAARRLPPRRRRTPLAAGGRRRRSRAQYGVIRRRAPRRRAVDERSGSVVDVADEVIVGGGIGGASLAYALAREGLGVTVREAPEEFEDRVRRASSASRRSCSTPAPTPPRCGRSTWSASAKRVKSRCTCSSRDSTAR